MNYNVTKKMNELKVGDIVKLSDNSYCAATVIKVTEKEVTFYRPYVITSDFETTAGVIPYIGTEQFNVYISDTSYFCYEADREIR